MRKLARNQGNQMLMQYVSMVPNSDAFDRAKQAEKTSILREIEEIERVKSTNDKQMQSRMSNYFNDHYAKMKGDIGINQNYGFMEEDPILEDVLKNIHANTKPSNFKHLLRKEQQVFKNSDQRK